MEKILVLEIQPLTFISFICGPVPSQDKTSKLVT